MGVEMRDFYVKQLVEAVLEGRQLTLRLYYTPDENGDGVDGMWDDEGIQAGKPSCLLPGVLNHEYLICHWKTGDEMNFQTRELTLPEAMKLVEEHFDY